MNETFKYILPIGVILTFFGTMINILMTSKNIKSTKYIDTITSERIKWIDIIRNEVTNIIVNINFTLKIYSENIKDREYEINNYEQNPEVQLETQLRYFDDKTSNALLKEKPIWSESDFVKYLYLLKLRLNPKEDIEIIEIIDYFIKFYNDSEFKSAVEIPEVQKKINLLIDKTQKLLKQEWEKIKQESKGKITKT